MIQTSGFALIIVGAANPDRACGRDLSSVVLAAVSAYDQAGKRIPSGEAPDRRHTLCSPPCNFCLNRFVFLYANDGLVRSLRMVHRELAIVDHGLFRQVVFPEGLLKEQVPGIGVIPEDARPGIASICFTASAFTLSGYFARYWQKVSPSAPWYGKQDSGTGPTPVANNVVV